MWGVRHFIVFIQLAAEDVNCAAGENSWKERPSMSLSIRSQKSRSKIWQFEKGSIPCHFWALSCFKLIQNTSLAGGTSLCAGLAAGWNLSLFGSNIVLQCCGTTCQRAGGCQSNFNFSTKTFAEHHVPEVSWIFQIWCRLWTMESLLQLAVESGETSPWCSNFQDLQAWNNAYMECCPGERCHGFLDAEFENFASFASQSWQCLVTDFHSLEILCEDYMNKCFPGRHTPDAPFDIPMQLGVKTWC